MRGHFWFSKKLEELEECNLFEPRITIAKLDTGEKVKYNIIRSDGSFDHGTKWSDPIYLGEGEVYSVGGTIQSPFDK